MQAGGDHQALRKATPVARGVSVGECSELDATTPCKGLMLSREGRRGRRSVVGIVGGSRGEER